MRNIDINRQQEREVFKSYIRRIENDIESLKYSLDSMRGYLKKIDGWENENA